MEKIETFESLIDYAEKNKKALYEISQELHSLEFEIPVSKIREQTKIYLNAMKEAVSNGLKSDELSHSKMVGSDCRKLINYYKKNNSIFDGVQRKVLLYSLSTSEENARMGKIVACPTAGSCGIVPSVILAYSDEKGLDEDSQINALLGAGLIGRIISNKVAISGAVMGCQGECGVASAMAAGALVEIMEGSVEQSINAVSLTLKNIMGLTCDPVAGLVEVPCVKRNTFLSVNALVGAELALSGIKSVIPPDEVVDAMYQTGIMMSPQLKESSQAGLAQTKTGLEITQRLNK